MSELTRDDVVRMAREIFGQSAVLPVPELERFAAMAYAAGQAAELEKARRVVIDQSVAALIEDRDTWKARAEFSYRQRDELTRQIAEAVAAEREACAKVCDDAEDTCNDSGIERDVYIWNRAAKYCAAKVRARGQLREAVALACAEAIRARGKGEAL